MFEAELERRREASLAFNNDHGAGCERGSRAEICTQAQHEGRGEGGRSTEHTCKQAGCKSRRGLRRAGKMVVVRGRTDTV